MSHISSILQSFNKEQRYGEQGLYDSVTQGKALLVYRWIDFEQGHDIHVESKDANPLYEYLKRDSSLLLNIGFMPSDDFSTSSTKMITKFDERVGMHSEDEKEFLNIHSYKTVITTEAELIYRNVKGQRINNFELITLTARRHDHENKTI